MLTKIFSAVGLMLAVAFENVGVNLFFMSMWSNFAVKLLSIWEIIG